MVSLALCLRLGANTASLALAPDSLFYGHDDLKDHLLHNQRIQAQYKLLKTQLLVSLELFSTQSVLLAVSQTWRWRQNRQQRVTLTVTDADRVVSTAGRSAQCEGAAGRGMHQEKNRASCTRPIRGHGTLPIILWTNTCIWYHNNAGVTLKKGECGTHP